MLWQFGTDNPGAGGRRGGLFFFFCPPSVVAGGGGGGSEEEEDACGGDGAGYGYSDVAVCCMMWIGFYICGWTGRTCPPRASLLYPHKSNPTIINPGLSSLLDAQARACRAEQAWFRQHLSPLALGDARSSLWYMRACACLTFMCAGVDGMDMHAILDLSSPKLHHPPILQNTYTTATRRPRRSTAPSSTSTRPHPPAPLRRRRRPPRRWGGSKSSSSNSRPSSLSGLSTSIT